MNSATTGRDSARPSGCILRQAMPLAGLNSALSFTLLLALGCAPAFAYAKASRRPPRHDAEHVTKEPFGNIPKGPLQIFISIDQQKLHLYSDGVHVADAPVATGVPEHPTPFGVFSVIQKQVFHRSNIYSNAPMPYMQRITWSGIALHEGEGVGHRASHGCIRMPHDFAVRLYGLTKLGAGVIIARGELKPVEFADPHLFVHKDVPAPTPPVAATPAPSAPILTAQTADPGKTTDSTDAAIAAQPAALGLRVGGDVVVAQSGPAAGDPAAPPLMQKSEPAVPDGSPSAPDKTMFPDKTMSPDKTMFPDKTVSSDKAISAPPATPAESAKATPVKRTPIAIFISRKAKKIYVRQNFEPVFDAPVTIEQPDAPLGTHVFTALELKDDQTTFRWTAVSMPGEPAKPVRNAENDRYSEKRGHGRRRDDETMAGAPPPQTPEQALARIEIPPDTIDTISQMMVPGSTLIVSDQGLGDETGEGTNFVVVTR